MAQTFYFRGNSAFGQIVETRLEQAGMVSAQDLFCADVALTYYTDQEALEEAYFGEEGLVQGANEGTLLIDLSATTPTFARELNAVCVVNNRSFVEAPFVVLSPGVADALSTQSYLACFAAGEEGVVEKALPVLELLFGEVKDVGGAGAAELAKAAFTLQMVAQVVSAIEADALYKAVRAQSGAITGSLSRAGALSIASDEVLEAVAAKQFSGTYSIEMFMAELKAALSAADDADLILPQAEAALHLLDLLAVVGGVDKAPSAISLMYCDEDSCAEAGLDWSRANDVYTQEAHEHMHEEDTDFGDYGDGQFFPGLGYASN